MSLDLTPKRVAFLILLIGAVTLAGLGLRGVFPPKSGPPIPGWEKFRGAGVEIWLPKDYEKVDIRREWGSVVEAVRFLGPEYASASQALEEAPLNNVLWVRKSGKGDSGLMPTVVVIKGVNQTLNVENFTDGLIGKLPAWHVVERKPLLLCETRAMRILLVGSLPGTEVEVKELIYLIKRGDWMWMVMFTDDLSTFDEEVPAFEQSIQMLKIIP